MNVVLGWVILVVILSAISWAPPLLDIRWSGSYGRAWWNWNRLLLPLLAGAALLTTIVMWALVQVGVVSG